MGNTKTFMFIKIPHHFCGESLEHKIIEIPEEFGFNNKITEQINYCRKCGVYVFDYINPHKASITIEKKTPKEIFEYIRDCKYPIFPFRFK